MIGYSLSGVPRGPAATLIEWANRQSSPTLALDVPSGFDASTGQIYEPAIRAAATLTIALPKLGMQTDDAAGHIGDLYGADISVPPELYRRLSPGLEIDYLFQGNDIIHIR